MPDGTLVRPFSSPFRLARDEYILTLEVENKSKNTIAIYGYAIDRLHRFVGDLAPAAIDTAVLRRFLRHLQQEGLSTTTQKDYLRAIKTWLRWLAAEGGYGVADDAGARAKAPRAVLEPIKPFTEAELKALIDACEKDSWRGMRQRAILALLLDTGMRASELCGVRLRDLDRCTVDILAVNDKTRKGRTIGLGRKGRLALGRWWTRQRCRVSMDQSPDSPLFPGADGEPMTPNSLLKLVSRLGDRAGVAGVHPHRFRHTFAILSLRAGMNPYTLMHTLGHTDLTMVKRYMAIVDSDVSADKAARSPLDRLKLTF